MGPQRPIKEAKKLLAMPTTLPPQNDGTRQEGSDFNDYLGLDFSLWFHQ